MRTFDASIINGIVNRYPEIAAAITHDPADGQFDAQPYVNALYSFILLDNRKDGAALFEWSRPMSGRLILYSRRLAGGATP